MKLKKHKKCKLCGKDITKKDIELAAQNIPERQKRIARDYRVCKWLGYCITCVREKQNAK